MIKLEPIFCSLNSETFVFSVLIGGYPSSGALKREEKHHQGQYRPSGSYILSWTSPSRSLSLSSLSSSRSDSPSIDSQPNSDIVVPFTKKIGLAVKFWSCVSLIWLSVCFVWITFIIHSFTLSANIYWMPAMFWCSVWS